MLETSKTCEEKEYPQLQLLITAFNCDHWEAPWPLGQSCGASPMQPPGKWGERIARALVSSLDLKRSGEWGKKKNNKQIKKSPGACCQLAPRKTPAAADGAPGIVAAPVAGDRRAQRGWSGSAPKGPSRSG